MKNKRTLVISGLALIFGLNLAGASVLFLSSSDPLPWENKFPSQCATPVLSLQYQNNDKNQPKVVSVTLTGDFSKCVGSQVLVTTFKAGHAYSYAVAEVVPNQGPIALRFEKQLGVGEFYQKFPMIYQHRLVSSGPLAPPTTSIAVEDVQVTFSWSWN